MDFKAQGQNGTFVSNIISQGEDVTDLYLTFYFERIYPNMEDDSEEANKASEQLCALAREAVSETVVVARKMVTEGEIKILC